MVRFILGQKILKYSEIDAGVVKKFIPARIRIRVKTVDKYPIITLNSLKKRSSFFQFFEIGLIYMRNIKFPGNENSKTLHTYSKEKLICVTLI